MKLKDFSNKDFLLERINDCEGLSEIEEYSDYIEAYDEQEDMYLHFHHNIDFDNLFDFGSFKVNKEKFFNILKNSLDDILFLMPDKIYFISNEDELDELLNSDDYCTQGMDIENCLGINWFCDSTIVINIALCRKLAQEESSKYNEYFEDIFSEIVWTTLVHELRHMVCDLGVIIPDELIAISEGSEDNVERYTNNCFHNSIIYDDYKCFY